MEIFKDYQAHKNLSGDLKVIGKFTNEVKSRLAEKTLDTLVELLNEELFMNLTEEGAVALEGLSSRHPESEIESLLDFLVFQNSVKVISAKEYNLSGNGEVDENYTSQVRVYMDGPYIDIDGDGKHSLVIENMQWVESDTCTLEDMELELFDWYGRDGGLA